MTHLNFFKFASAALLFLNLGLITFFLLTRPNPPHRGPKGKQGFKKEAVKILKLDPNQEELFYQAASRHNNNIRLLSQEQGLDLSGFLDSKEYTSISDSSTIAFVEKLMWYEEQKMRLTFEHFDEIKAILNKQQYADFQVFMNTVLKTILFPDKKPMKGPKDL